MAGRLYDRQSWRRLRKQHLRREPLCRMCMERGVVKPAVDVDHIKPLADGGEPMDDENLRSLCHECHSIVTAAARNGREVCIKGCDVHGCALDPNHWWNK